MGLGYVEGVTHDYVRHGTTTLFAALDIATGAVFTECKSRHRHQEFLSFMRHLDEGVPQELDAHLIVVRDIAGLYLNPPDHALVLCVDEKSQIQALNPSR